MVVGSSSQVARTAISVSPTLHVFPQLLHGVESLLRRHAIDVRLLDTVSRPNRPGAVRRERNCGPAGLPKVPGRLRPLARPSCGALRLHTVPLLTPQVPLND